MANIAQVASATSVSVENLSLIAHNNTPVITTELLANLYATDTDNIRKNFSRNLERFVEGKHYFKLEGQALRDFKNCVTLSHAVAKNTRNLILWTERGAARHAKMLDTDQAWEVFEKLEDCYFTKKPVEQLALTNGQHYVVAKDGVVIYHTPLSGEFGEMIAQPALSQSSLVIDIPREDTRHNNTLSPHLFTLKLLRDGYGHKGNPLVRLFATLTQAQKEGKPVVIKELSGARLIYEMTESLAWQYNQALDTIKIAADNYHSNGMFLPISR